MENVAVITGGSRGIGAAATARLAAERGYAVCVNYLKSRTAADAIVREIRSGGGRAVAVAADVAQEPDVVRMNGLSFPRWLRRPETLVGLSALLLSLCGPV